jgi:hypothetical protein
MTADCSAALLKMGAVIVGGSRVPLTFASADELIATLDSLMCAA